MMKKELIKRQIIIWKWQGLNNRKSLIHFNIGEVDINNNENFKLIQECVETVSYKEKIKVKDILKKLSEQYGTNIVKDNNHLLTEDLRAAYTVI